MKKQNILGFIILVITLFIGRNYLASSMLFFGPPSPFILPYYSWTAVWFLHLLLSGGAWPIDLGDRKSVV